MMEAAEAKVQRVLGRESTQFLVPHYQRPYSWRQDQWTTLWRDVVELLEDPEAKPHFLGSIVTSPARSVPEGVEKRLLIDGQQRLTTLLVFLLVIRDRARAEGLTKLAERLQDIVTNRHEDGSEHYRLLPTQSDDENESDREAFVRMVHGTRVETRSGIGAAYDFFRSKLARADAPALEPLLHVVIGRLTLVSIVLDEKDNPHRIFESLNAKGRPLSQADLIRNYFFMRLPEKEHERVYLDLWRPMQRRLGEDALTDFVRHYLTRLGALVRETDVYAALKALVEKDGTLKPNEHLQDLARFAEYYEVLLYPERAASPRIRERLQRLKRLEVTVAYPFLLGVYAEMAAGTCTEDDACAIFDMVENFLIRRFVCAIPTHGLNKIFASLYAQSKGGPNLVERVQKNLSASLRAYPRDDEFRERLRSTRLYGSGDRREKTKFLLERLEAALGHKEAVVADTLTIEHVMPQSLSDDWREDLGPDWEEDHEEFLHTIGNLTLTSYNAELSNAPFTQKKKRFADSHVGLNCHFAGVEHWNAEAIERRAEALSEQAVLIWPYFGSLQPSSHADPQADVLDDVQVTRTVPARVRIRGHERLVVSWVDVAVATVEGIIAVGDEEFQRVVDELPRFVNRDATAFRRSSRLRRLSNGAYVETNLSAGAIYRLCVQAASIAGLGPADWSVEYAEAKREEDPGEGGAEPNAHLKQLRLEFWNEVRAALLATNAFPSVRAARGTAWLDLAAGRSGMWLSLRTYMSEKRLEGRFLTTSDIADRVMPALLAEREAIESEVGTALEWVTDGDDKGKGVRLFADGDILDRTAWPAATAWLTQHAVAFRSALGRRVAKLDLRTIRVEV